MNLDGAFLNWSQHDGLFKTAYQVGESVDAAEIHAICDYVAIYPCYDSGVVALELPVRAEWGCIAGDESEGSVDVAMPRRFRSSVKMKYAAENRRPVAIARGVEGCPGSDRTDRSLQAAIDGFDAGTGALRAEPLSGIPDRSFTCPFAYQGCPSAQPPCERGHRPGNNPPRRVLPARLSEAG